MVIGYDASATPGRRDDRDTEGLGEEAQLLGRLRELNTSADEQHRILRRRDDLHRPIDRFLRRGRWLGKFQRLGDACRGTDEHLESQIQHAGTRPAGTSRDDRLPYSQRKVVRRDDLAGIFRQLRSEEHTSELQSLMRISYAVFCL